MMTFQLSDDRILRVRQRKFLGPVTVELLGPVQDSYGMRKMIRWTEVPSERFVKFLESEIQEDGKEG